LGRASIPPMKPFAVFIGKLETERSTFVVSSPVENTTYLWLL
jgi:hypothetical protein